MKGLALAVPARLAPAANAATPRRKHAPDRNERNVRFCQPEIGPVSASDAVAAMSKHAQPPTGAVSGLASRVARPLFPTLLRTARRVTRTTPIAKRLEDRSSKRHQPAWPGGWRST